MFFTRNIEPNIPFDLIRDCSAPKKSKKQTRISVTFEIPAEVNIQKNLVRVQQMTAQAFTISKLYQLDPSVPEGYSVAYEIDGQQQSPEEAMYVDQFLNLFNFRYITADRSAQQVLENNLPELQSELQYRLNKSGSAGTSIGRDPLEKVRDLSDKLFMPITNELIKADPNIEAVNLSMPENLAELLRSAKYQLKMQQGDSLNEIQQGAGIQSLLLFTVLVLIDKNFHRKFGWKIATIWAIEEPEVYLHHDLEIQLSNYLAGLSNESGNRFQILMTTHSPTFTGVCDSLYHTQLNISGLTEIQRLNYHDLLIRLQSFGIISGQNLFALFPDQPIIIVEGPIDEYIIQRVLTENGFGNFRIYSIQTFLNNPQVRGASQMIRLLEGSVHMLKHRKPKKGILAVFDWDAEDGEFDPVLILCTANQATSSFSNSSGLR